MNRRYLFRLLDIAVRGFLVYKLISAFSNVDFAKYGGTVTLILLFHKKDIYPLKQLEELKQNPGW